MKNMLVPCVLALLLAMTGSVCAQEVVKIGVHNFPPFYEVEQGKDPSGSYLDFLKAACQRAGYQYEVQAFPATRLYQNLSDGESHVYVGLKGVKAYDESVLYSKSKVLTIDLRVYTRPDTPLPTSKEQLNGKTLLVISGYSYGGLINYLMDPANNITLDPVSDHALNFKKLQAKRADYVIDFRRPAEEALKMVNIPGIQSHSFLLLDCYVIVSKKTPNAQDVLTRLEKAFEEFKNEGRL